MKRKLLVLGSSPEILSTGLCLIELTSCLAKDSMLIMICSTPGHNTSERRTVKLLITWWRLTFTVANLEYGLLKKLTKKNIQIKTGILLVQLLVNSISDWTSPSTTLLMGTFLDQSPSKTSLLQPDNLATPSNLSINSNRLNTLPPNHQSSFAMPSTLTTFQTLDQKKLQPFLTEMSSKWRTSKVRLLNSLI